jgi:nicotinamidase-related amidase
MVISATKRRKRSTSSYDVTGKTGRDYFVLTPKHSGFFDTTLDTLLKTLRIRRVIVTGIAVLFELTNAWARSGGASARLTS